MLDGVRGHHRAHLGASGLAVLNDSYGAGAPSLKGREDPLAKLARTGQKPPLGCDFLLTGRSAVGLRPHLLGMHIVRTLAVMLLGLPHREERRLRYLIPKMQDVFLEPCHRSELEHSDRAADSVEKRRRAFDSIGHRHQ